jgi:hypothetical protein
MPYQILTILACGTAGFLYVLLYFWSSIKIGLLDQKTNKHGLTFDGYRKTFFAERGFPFIFLSLILPIVLGSAASATLGRHIHATVATISVTQAGSQPSQPESTSTTAGTVVDKPGASHADSPSTTSASAVNPLNKLGMSSDDSKPHLVNIGLELLEAVLVVLITLELAYWTGSTARECHSLLQAAFFLDLSVLISFLCFVGPPPASGESSDWQLLQIGVVNILSVAASYRVIYISALWDLFRNQPRADVF